VLDSFGNPTFDVDGHQIFTIDTVDIKPAGVVDLFVAIFHGFESKTEIIFFVMSIGAFIFVVMKSKSLDALTQKIA
jgi:uncharacterized ion transporter superfamily protein YfcC